MSDLDEQHRDQMAAVIAYSLANVARLPEWMQAPALGRDLRPMGDLAADALVPLIAEWIANARVQALREAADEWMDSDDPNAYIAPDRWLRDRANRIDR